MKISNSAAMKEVLKRLTKYEIKIRKSLATHQQGDLRSIFKGTGLAFEDLRPYQYGDDIRRIDWNVSAKGHGTYVKRFREDREQVVFFVLDVSGSCMVGRSPKWETMREVCGVLALAALNESSQVGFLAFSDQKELLLKPNKGAGHKYRLLHSLYHLPLHKRGTDLGAACRMTMELMKHKSLIFFLSDFVSQGHSSLLRSLMHKHDVVLLHVHSEEEVNFPSLGLIPVIDVETGLRQWVHSGSSSFQGRIRQQAASKQSTLRRLSHSANAHYVPLKSGESYTAALIKLFQVRHQSPHRA